MIPKAMNTFEYKDESDQSNLINDTTSNTVRAIKAIKAIRSMIWSERYNQSNMVSGIIRTNPGVVILPVALTQRPET